MKKVWIIAGLLIVIGGSAYLLFSKKGDSKTSDNTSGDDTSGGGTTGDGGGGTTGGGGGGTTTKSNFDRLKQNIGSQFTNLKGGAIRVNFNGNKNFAQFYTNNRVAIYTTSNNNIIIKGSYANGGKKIVLDNGKTIESGSIWRNLNKTIL